MAQVTYPHHSPKQQRITQLPGENGFHARDGSLLRKKREQWEKEKAEAGQNSWFPFGDKRNKKVVNINSDKCQKEGNVDEQFDTSHNFQLETVQNVFQQSPPHFTLTNKQQSNYNNQNSCLQEINDNSSPSTTNIYQPTLLPFFVDYSMTGHFHSQHQLIPAINSYDQHQSPQHQLFPLPSGLIPVQTSSFQNSMPITFSGPATTIIDPLFLPHKLPSVLQTPPYSFSSPDSGTSSSKGVIIPSDEINPCISTEELLRKNTPNNNNVNSPNICWKEELDRQVEEKKIAELIEHEKRLSEQIALEREAKLKFEREENERAAEEQKRVSKIEVRDNYNQACLNGLQRAQQEAEALKRAKLYRHILLDGQADLETSKQVLKIDDDKLVLDVLRQLRELELQKSIERSEIKIRSNSPSTTKSPKHQNSSPNSTPKFIKNHQNNLNKEQHSFSRANSWNVKQSRTLPTNWTSHLPVPICQQKQSLIKQSGEKLDITTTHLSTLKPLTNENKNNKEKTPPSKGLFEQLTLRRPRSSFNNKKETISPSEITTSNMICAKQGVDIEIDYLNFDEGIINNCSTKNNKFNNSKISDQNENFKNNNTKQENIYGISRSNILNCKSNENSSSTSTQSTNSPGSSTTSSITSKESANVFKFRTLLSTPSGSQDDLFNNNNNSTTPISITRSSKTKNNNNTGVMLTTMAPSPFSRKTSKDINSNKECIGIRQSLRSPTMRRLQESLQSLSTIDDENEVVVLEDNKLNVKSRSCTPKPFNCKNSQYRSFNMRRDNTARSRQILDHLAAVRAQLKNSQAQLEKTISKQNLVDNNE